MTGKKALLNWYVGFINADLETTPEPDKWKLAAEISRLAVPKNLRRPDEPPDEIRQGILEIIGPGLAKKTGLKSIQKALKDFLDYLFVQKTRIEDGKGLWRDDSDFEFFPSLGTARMNMRVVAVADLKYKAQRGEEGMLYRHTADNLEHAAIRVEYEGSTKQETLLFQFVRLLEDVPLKALRTCKECGKYFIHLSTREREYCSNLCASRYGVREKRELLKSTNAASLEGEQGKSAKRARASYVRKVRKKHPHAKIGSRPRKHKT